MYPCGDSGRQRVRGGFLNYAALCTLRALRKILRKILALRTLRTFRS